MKAQSFCPLQNGKRKMYQQNNHRVKGIRVKISGNFSRGKKMTISKQNEKAKKNPGKEKSLIVIIVKKKRNIETTKTDYFFIIFANINFRDLVITKNFANIYFRELIHNSRNSRKLMIAKINDLKVYELSIW